MAGNDSYTKLLLHFDSENPYLDSSSSLKTFTASGSPVLSTSSKKFGDGAIRIPHNSFACITCPSSSDVSFGTSDFTIDFWVNVYEFYATGSFRNILQAGVSFFLTTSGSNVNILANINGSFLTATFASDVNAWHHIELDKDASYITLYLDGVFSGHYSVSGSYGGVSQCVVGTPSIGCECSVSFDEVRISKGVERHSSAFTPETSAYSPEYVALSAVESQTATVANHAELSVHLPESIGSSDVSAYTFDLRERSIAEAQTVVSASAYTFDLRERSVAEAVTASDSENGSITGFTTNEPESQYASDSSGYTFDLRERSIQEAVVADDSSEGDITSITAGETVSQTDESVGEITTQLAEVAEFSSSYDVPDYVFDLRERSLSEETFSEDFAHSILDNEVEASLVETQEAIEVTTGIPHFLDGSIGEATSALDELNVTNPFEDVVGVLNGVTEKTIVDFSGLVNTVGRMGVVVDDCTFSGSGLTNSLGKFAVVSGTPVFVGNGLVEVVGEMVVATKPCIAKCVGENGSVGEMNVTSALATFRAVGIVDTVGEFAVTTKPGTFSAVGRNDIFGIVDVNTEKCLFSGSGLVDNAGALACATEDCLFTGVGVVDTVGAFAVTTGLCVFSARDDLSKAIVKAYCLNLLKKGLISKFTNYGFNSFALIDGQLLGAKATGLFQLTGDLDDSSNIDAVVEFPVSKFGTTKTKQLRAMKVFGRTDGDLTVTANDGKSGNWEVPLVMAKDESADNVVGYFPFTARGRYLQLSVENVDGCDFLLDQVELDLYVLGRA